MRAALRSPTDARLFATPALAMPEPAPEQTEAVTIPPLHVRAPHAWTDAPTTPARAALSPMQAPAAEAVPTPTSPVREPRLSEPKPPRADAKPIQSKRPLQQPRAGVGEFVRT